VTLQLVKGKCVGLPILVYELECFSLQKADIKSLDFAVIRFLMKLFKCANIYVINDDGRFFKVELPSEMLEKKSTKFNRKFVDRKNLYRFFDICV